VTQFAFSDFLPGAMATALRRIAIEGGPPPANRHQQLVALLRDGTRCVGYPWRDVLTEAADLIAQIEGGPPPGPELGTPTPKPVDTVIDLLGKRLVGDVDRGRLHKALDRADAPDLSREGMDKGLRRAIRR